MWRIDENKITKLQTENLKKIVKNMIDDWFEKPLQLNLAENTEKLEEIKKETNDYLNYCCVTPLKNIDNLNNYPILYGKVQGSFLH